MFIKKIILVGIAVVLLGFFAYLAYYKIRQGAAAAPVNPEIPESIASGRYAESLKEVLKLDVRVEKSGQDKGTVWIFLSNKSAREFIPAEESHRSIVCLTEIIDRNNKVVDTFTDYFKRPPPDVETLVPNTQIAPGATVKFGYELYIPHGTVRVTVTYVDFSVFSWSAEEKDGGKVFITQQEVQF